MLKHPYSGNPENSFIQPINQLNIYYKKAINDLSVKLMLLCTSSLVAKEHFPSTCSCTIGRGWRINGLE
jgi:hypothetical protein